MKHQNNRYHLDFAEVGDGPEILRILEEIDFSGRISLMYTRRPDPYLSFHLEGPHTEIVVCRDMERKKVAGFGACSIRRLYLNGEEANVGYLFGLRVSKEYRGLHYLARGYEKMWEHFREMNVKCYLTTILEENIYAQKLLGKKRTIMPDYLPVTRFGTFILKTKKGSDSLGGYRLKQAENDDIPALLQFLNQEGQKKQFFPVLDEKSFSGTFFPGLVRDSFYLLLDQNNRIAACGAVWDQRGYKQYVLQGYQGILKYIRPLSAVFELFGYPALPRPGSKLDFYTLSFWAVRQDDPEIFRVFLELVASCRKGFSFFVLGLSEDNPLLETVKRLPHLDYWSRAYLVDWAKDGRVTRMVRGRPVYLECGLL